MSASAELRHTALSGRLLASVMNMPRAATLVLTGAEVRAVDIDISAQRTP